MNLPFDVLNAIETLKGGQGSGNWGHQGLAGVHGGSSPTKNINVVAFDDGGEELFVKYVLQKTRSTDVYNGNVRGLMKDDIVHRITWNSTLDYGTANELAKAWSVTSNKTYDAYLIQKAASEEFGVPLSPWQKERFKYYDFIEKEYHNLAEEFANKCIDTFSEKGFSIDTFNATAHEFSVQKQQWVKDEYGIDVIVRAQLDGIDGVDFIISNMNVYNDHPTHGQKNLDGVFGYNDSVSFGLDILQGDPTKAIKYFLGEHDEAPSYMSKKYKRLPDMRKAASEHKENIREFVSTVYDNTQTILKKVFPNATHVELYRGIKGIKEYRYDDEKYHSSAIESWTIHQDTANDFGDGYLKLTVPIEKIYSTCLSGVGCLSEYEFVILGGDYDYEFGEFVW